MEASTLVHAGELAPDFEMKLLSGDVLQLSELRGKVVLLNFFATWCPPCLEEMSQMEKVIQQEYGAEPNFLMVAIGREHSASELRAFQAKNGFSFPMAPDPERMIYAKYADSYIPRNVLIGKDGIVLLSSAGYTPEEFQVLLNAIQNALTGS